MNIINLIQWKNVNIVISIIITDAPNFLNTYYIPSHFFGSRNIRIDRKN